MLNHSKNIWERPRATHWEWEAPQSPSELCSPTRRRTSAWRSTVAQKARAEAVVRRLSTRSGACSLDVASESVACSC